MNAKKKRVAPLQSSIFKASASNTVHGDEYDDPLDSLGDELDKIFGNSNDIACGYVDLDDWDTPGLSDDVDDKKTIASKKGVNEVTNCSVPPEDKLKDPWETPTQNESPSGTTSNLSFSKSASKTFKHVKESGGQNVANNSVTPTKPAVQLMFTSKEYEEDPVLKLRFSKRDIPAAIIKDMAKNMEFLSLTAALKSNEGKSYFTGGVVTANVRLRTSGSLLTLTDLASEPCSVRVLLFGAAFEQYSKIAVGSIVIITNPRKGKPHNGRESLVVNDEKLLSVAGNSKDYGICGSRTKSGGSCKIVVNLKLCRYCSFHAIAQFKEQAVSKNLSSVAKGNGLLADKKSQEKSDLWMTPVNKIKLVAGKANFSQIKKDRDTLSRLDSAMSCVKTVAEDTCNKTHEERKLLCLTSTKRKFKELESSPRGLSSFQNHSTEISKIERMSGCFDHVKTSPLFQKRMSAAKQRALNYARQSGGITPNAKKSKLETENPPVVRKTKNDILTPEYLALMKEKPLNPELLAAAETQERNKRFDRLSIIEEIGEKLAHTTEVPVRAIRCLVCDKNYFQVPLQCVKSKHKCRVVTATKRFFQCSGCKKRTTTLERLPTVECDKCGRWAWLKCGVAGDKVCTASNKLSVRGLEEKFLGSVATEANLSLLVPDDK